MEINSRKVIEAILPEARVVRKDVGYKPIANGLAIGVYLQKLSYQTDRYKVTAFSNLAVKENDPGLLHPQEIDNDGTESWSSNDLIESLVAIRSRVSEYELSINSFEKFSEKSTVMFEEFNGVNSLFEIVACHYLDLSCKLPNISFDLDALVSYINPMRPYEFERIGEIITLVTESSDPNYEMLKSTRIKSWLQDKRLPASFFD